jgi:hypothetical protein
MSRNQWVGVGGPLNRATKGIGSLIGLATKAHAHHKEKAAEKENANTENVATNETSHDASYEDNEPDEEPDEENWALDDASIELSADRPNDVSRSSSINGFQSWYDASLNEAVAMPSHIATASTAVEKPRFCQSLCTTTRRMQGNRRGDIPELFG